MTDLATRRAHVLEQAEAAGLRLVRFLYCDLDGVVRGKASGMNGLSQRMETGIGLTVAMQAFSMLDQLAPVEGMGPVGEIRLVPDPDTFVVAPYAPNTGVAFVDMLTPDRQPYAADARWFLRKMVERAARDGMRLHAAFEPEWTLAAPGPDGADQPADRSLCFSSSGMGDAADVIDTLVGWLEAQGLTVEQYYPELGGGQQELSIAPAPAVAAADRLLHYKESVRAAALRYGLRASFAPKPWPDAAGNGCHLHFSLWDDGGSANLFADPASRYGVSDTACHFAAGVLEHLPGLLALTCASVNSYRRLKPQMWASAYRAWGFDNREAAVRVPSTFWGHERDSANIELKACDSSANPYLALGGVLAAGLDGVERGLDLPPPVLVDPHLLTDAQRAAVGATRHPESLTAALDALRADSVLMDALGEALSSAYLAVKELDINLLSGKGETAEFEAHRFKF